MLQILLIRLGLGLLTSAEIVRSAGVEQSACNLIRPRVEYQIVSSAQTRVTIVALYRARFSLAHMETSLNVTPSIEFAWGYASRAGWMQ